MADDIHWYHTIELPDGRVTPGLADTRSAVRRIPFPASLEGKRCLDVGTADGFWAFEMERRGAREVVAIDVDDPTRRDWPWTPRPPMGPGRRNAFEHAHQALGSSVERRDMTIYELSPAAIGTFDFVYIGDLLLHLRDPVRALASVGGVLDGELLVNDVVSLALTLLHPFRPAASLEVRFRPRWWVPNMAGLRGMVQAAGLNEVSHGGPYFAKFGRGYPAFLKNLRAHGLRFAPREIAQRLLGAPHGWVLARPSR